jgi:hypothetical protein
MIMSTHKECKMQNVKCKIGKKKGIIFFKYFSLCSNDMNNSVGTYAMCTVFFFNYNELQGLVSILSANGKNLTLREWKFARAKCYVDEK